MTTRTTHPEEPGTALADAEQPSLRPPSGEEVLKCLEKVLSSEGFAGSPQLCRFLRYVVENGLSGQSASLKESVIGIAVFNRGASYDQKADPIVRVEARRLRSRLEAYYREAGLADSVRISLPKGGYLPVFERSGPHEPRPLPAVRLEVRPPAAKPSTPRRRWVPALAAAVAAVALISASAAWALRPQRIVKAFWSSVLDGSRPALIIPADSALVMLQDLTHQPVSLPDYVSGSYRTQTGPNHEPVSPLVASLGSRRYTSIADLEFSTTLSHRPEATRHGVTTRYARDVRVEDLNNNNVVLLGARHSNPWVELFEKDATFRLEHNEVTGTFRVVNVRPQPGEPAEIAIAANDFGRQIYGIVTFHRSGTGNAIVVAGTTVAGTEAAGDFLLDDSRMLPWLRQAESGGEVKGFDLLLRGRSLDGSAPRAEVVAFHVQH